MAFIEKNTHNNDDTMLVWLEKTENVLDNILNDDIEEIFSVSGQYYKEVDEIYNNILYLQELLAKIHTSINKELPIHRKSL